MVEAEPEKRATRRFALRLPVAVTYSDNGSQQKEAQTRDVSARGICFYVDSAIAPGSHDRIYLNSSSRNHPHRKHPRALQRKSGTSRRWRR